MNSIDSITKMKKFISNNQLAFLYISTNECSVCIDLLPKIEELLSKYPHIASSHIDINKMPEIASELSVFTVPVLILFIDEKEIIRESRFVRINDLDNNINRYYSMLID